MSKLLGLIEVLESKILDSKKIPLSTKVIIEEQEVLDIFDKMREVIKSEEIINNTIEVKEKTQANTENTQTSAQQQQSNEYIEKELKKIKKLRHGAEDYAQYILSNLQLTVTKMQNNLLKLEKNIESGRNMIEQKNELNHSSTDEVVLKEIVNE